MLFFCLQNGDFWVYLPHMINIEKQKELLLAQQLEIEADLDALGTRDERGGWSVRPDEGDGAHADPIDNADVAEDFEEKIARLEVLEAQHAQILKALAAIKAGTYGICEISGDKIAEKRLKAYPAATTTVEHSR